MILKNSILNQTSIPILAKGLDTATLRGKAIANNMANLTTPDYQRIEVEFESELQKALDDKQLQADRTDSNHMYAGRPLIEQVKPKAYRPEDPTLPGEINNVDVDMEMAHLAETQTQYNLGIRLLRDRFDLLSQAAKRDS